MMQQVGWRNPKTGTLHKSKMDLDIGADWEPLYIHTTEQPTVEFDREARSYYVRLQWRQTTARTLEYLSGAVMIDVDIYGTVIGVEVLP